MRNVWDSKNGRVRQETVKYLGRSSKVALEDIPKEFQNNPDVISFIASHSSDAQKMEHNMKEKMLELLMRNDTNSLVDIFEKYTHLFGLVRFYERLLTPVMYKVGQLWEAGRLSVATEHICSNAAQTLVKIINERTSNPKPNRNTLKILICTPEGEYHSLGCMVIESYLRSKGYSISNISPSVPSDSVIDFASKYNPDLIMISLTLADSIEAAKKLINKILESSINVSHILVGGTGIQSMKTDKQKNDLTKVDFLKGSKLSDILPSIREITKARTKISNPIKK